MTVQETLAYFDKATVRRRFEAALREAKKACKQQGKIADEWALSTCDSDVSVRRIRRL